MEEKSKTLIQPKRRFNPNYKGQRMLPKPPEEGAFKEAPDWAKELYGQLKLMEYSIASTNREVEKIWKIVRPQIIDDNGSKKGGI